MAKRKRKRKRRDGPWAWLTDLAGRLPRPHLTASGRAVRATAWAIAVALLVFGWIAGVPRLERRVAAAAPDAVPAVEFIDLPAWVNGDLLALLELTARRRLSADPFDQRALADARRALLNTGWFDSIDQLRRASRDRVVVRATFARPAAVIRDPEGDHLVDMTGRLLPRTFPHEGAKHLLVISGVHFDRPQRPGAQWDGADVTAALRLLRLIHDKPWRDQVKDVDASDYLANGTLVLATDLGASIIWGSAPGDESELEIPAARKLAYLDKAWEEFRRIDTRHVGKLHFYDRGYFAE